MRAESGGTGTIITGMIIAGTIINGMIIVDLVGLASTSQRNIDVAMALGVFAWP
jgi:uncharacterized membrane protein YdcZ (DUF606 family)